MCYAVKCIPDRFLRSVSKKNYLDFKKIHILVHEIIEAFAFKQNSLLQMQVVRSFFPQPLCASSNHCSTDRSIKA